MSSDRAPDEGVVTTAVDVGRADAVAPAPARERRRTRLRVRATLAINVLSVLAFFALWTVATEKRWIAPIFLPSPAMVTEEAGKLVTTGELWSAILASSRRVFSGFALATAVAVPLGIVMGVWGPAKAVFDPFISLLRPLPSITWIPMTMLWLGIGESQKTAIVFLGSWIYILLSTVESTKRVDPTLIRAARNLGASDVAVMREVILPGALPGIITGLKVTLAIAWSCVLSAEMVAAQTGLGALIWIAKDWGNLPLVLVGMTGISLTVLVADALANQLERLLLPWERYRRG